MYLNKSSVSNIFFLSDKNNHCLFDCHHHKEAKKKKRKRSQYKKEEDDHDAGIHIKIILIYGRKEIKCYK